MAISTTTVECSRSPTLISPNIKQEKINQEKTKDQTQKQQTTPITFSINNILKNDFGHSKKQQSNSNYEQVRNAGEKWFTHRSNDDFGGENGVSSPKKQKLDTKDFKNDQTWGEFKHFFNCFYNVCLLNQEKALKK